MNDIKHNKQPKCVNFDNFTVEKCEKYAREHGLSFSSIVRLAVNEFFIQQEKC